MDQFRSVIQCGKNNAGSDIDNSEECSESTLNALCCFL